MFDYLGVSMSLAGNGSSIVIGAPYTNNGKGVTRIYKLSNNSWIKFDKDIKGENLLFVGSSVSISDNGSRIAVGNGDYETFTKSVRIYNI